jgi:hypothetical protein
VSTIVPKTRKQKETIKLIAEIISPIFIFPPFF